MSVALDRPTAASTRKLARIAGVLFVITFVTSLGYVTAGVVECAFIAVGILSVLSIVTLRQDAAGADGDSLVVVGQSLMAIKDWAFLLGPGFVVGFCLIAEGFKASSHPFDDARDASVNGGARAPAVAAQ